jgi:urease accessory protein
VNLLALTRLLRLASPALPVGAFAYSQGLEWAVESGVVHDERSAQAWVQSLLKGSLATFELPVLVALIGAWRSADTVGVTALNAVFLAARETAELRAETLAMGAALLAALFAGSDIDCTALKTIPEPCYPTSFAFACAAWRIGTADAALGYCFAWLENQVTAAIKLVPLGQSAGQKILARLSPLVATAVEAAIRLEKERWSNFAPLYAIASCRHETQYTRLFRS